MTKAIIFDIDNTLTDDVSWLKSTELLGASVATHIDIFDRFSKNELSYEASKKQLIQLWQDTGNNNKSFWEAMFAKWPLKADARPLVEYAQEQTYKTALITGSFDLFAEAIARKLGIPFWYANTEMVWDGDGNLIDFRYVRDQAAQKLVHLQQFTEQQGIHIQDCVVIGDGDNDIELFKATKQGIAVGKDSQGLIDVAWKHVDSLAKVKAILNHMKPLTDKQIRQLLALCRETKPTARRNIKSIYLARVGADILDYAIELYPHESKAAIRVSFIFYAIQHADDPRAIKLATMALTDRAESVRYWAISIFAVRGDAAFIPLLQRHGRNRPKDTDTVAKAIIAIQKQDHSLFMSIGHPANGIATIDWNVSPPDPMQHLDQDSFRQTVEEFIEKYCPEVVTELKRILGPLYK